MQAKPITKKKIFCQKIDYVYKDTHFNHFFHKVVPRGIQNIKCQSSYIYLFFKFCFWFNFRTIQWNYSFSFDSVSILTHIYKNTKRHLKLALSFFLQHLYLDDICVLLISVVKGTICMSMFKLYCKLALLLDSIALFFKPMKLSFFFSTFFFG